MGCIRTETDIAGYQKAREHTAKLLHCQDSRVVIQVCRSSRVILWKWEFGVGDCFVCIAAWNKERKGGMGKEMRRGGVKEEEEEEEGEVGGKE